MLGRLRQGQPRTRADDARSQAEESDYDEYGVASGDEESARAGLLRAAADRAVERATAAAARKPAAAARRPPVLGPGVLLGPAGFRALRELAASEFYGQAPPADERDALRHFDRAVRVCRDWARAMNPSHRFRDTAAKVERQCRTAQMRAYLAALERAARENASFDEVSYMSDAAASSAVAALGLSAPPEAPAE